MVPILLELLKFYCICVSSHILLILLFSEKLIQNGAKDESGLYEMLQEYMVENESLRYVFCLIGFFTSHQQSFSYKGMGLPGLN